MYINLSAIVLFPKIPKIWHFLSYESFNILILIAGFYRCVLLLPNLRSKALNILFVTLWTILTSSLFVFSLYYFSWDTFVDGSFGNKIGDLIAGNGIACSLALHASLMIPLTNYALSVYNLHKVWK